MENEKIVRKFHYLGKEVGEIVEYKIVERDLENPFSGKDIVKTKREFRTNVEEIEAIDLVREMRHEDKVHMKNNAYGVYRLLQYHKINPDDYVENEDIMIYIASKGYKNLTELNHGDKRAWELVKQRGLEAELFQDFK